MTFPTPDIYYYTACFALLFFGVAGGAIRWFHVCRPYAEQSDYFYPARRQVTFFYTFQLLLVPYLIHPYAPDTWLYVRIFGILYYPVCFTMLLHRYFFSGEGDKRLNRRNIGVLPFLLILVLCGFAFAGGDRLSPYRNLIMGVSSVLSLPVCFYMCRAMLWLKRKIDRYHESAYSNSENFPYKFASRLLFTPLLWVALMWVIFLADSRDAKMWIDVCYTMWQIVFLIIILHPQRDERASYAENAVKEEIRVEMEAGAREESGTETAGTAVNAGKLAALKQDLLPAIEKAFREDRIYLNPDLTIQDLATAICSNRRYTSLVISDVYGSFLTYVNCLRIEHLLRLKEENPELKQVELLKKSGFNTRASYNKWLSYYKSVQNRK